MKSMSDDLKILTLRDLVLQLRPNFHIVLMHTSIFVKRQFTRVKVIPSQNLEIVS